LEEDNFLIEKVKEIGRKWVKLTNFFPHRSDISLKNRFEHLIRNKPPLFDEKKSNQNDFSALNSSGSVIEDIEYLLK
jgi:hypothetical protein